MTGVETNKIFKKLGLSEVYNLEDALYHEYGRISGQMHVKQIACLFDESDRRLEENDGTNPHILRQNDLVDYMNTSPKLSIICAGFYDYDFIRQMADYLVAHKELIGEKVIDLGCGNGILTCFAAILSPESKVRGVDISDGAIGVAAKIAESLDIDNADFEFDEGTLTAAASKVRRKD